MQSYHSIEPQSNTHAENLVHSASIVPGIENLPCDDLIQPVNEPTQFYSQFVDSLEMGADVSTVSKYFDGHHEWFQRCAHPMKAEPIGQNSYALVIGQFGAFGYEVEPKIGLDLLPQDAGIYRIETVPVPDYTPPGYDVDFRAAMELVPVQEPLDRGAWGSALPTNITRVQWTLDLTVSIQFPRFIHTLPKPLIKTTGDRLLKEIVRQVSGRLNRKVLEDFHKTHELAIPKRSKRWLFRKSQADSVNEVLAPPETGDEV